MWFLLIFLAIPLIEIRIFALVAGEIGLLPAFLLCVLSAIIGTSIVRAQGFTALLATQSCLIRREMPVRAVFDGVGLTLAGILLIIPGFFTDFLALILMVPPVRGLLYRLMGRRFDEQGRPRDPNVIEGEFVRMDDAKLPRRDSDQP